MLPASRAAEGENAWKSLSEREQEVLKMVAFGHTSVKIAEQPNLSAKSWRPAARGAWKNWGCAPAPRW